MPIFDQGYQHWNGQTSGHAWRWFTIARQGVRSALKGRLMRIALLAAWSPAIALAAMLCVWGLLERGSTVIASIRPMLEFLYPQLIADPKHFRVVVWTLSYDYFTIVEMQISMILILLVGPNLISQDLRFNALPLYLSRPMRRIDYFLGKLGVIVGFLAMIVVLPATAAWVLGLLFSLDISLIHDTFRLLVGSIAWGLAVSVSAGLLVLAMSSLTRNSRYVALIWLGLWFISWVTSTAMTDINRNRQRNRIRTDQFRAYQEENSTVAPKTPDEMRQEIRRRQNVRQQGYLHMQQLQSDVWEATKTDWRPMISYTTNLTRLEQQFLGTQPAWETVASFLPPEQQGAYLMRMSGPQYPWIWSAELLAGLSVVSIGVLQLRIRSLDRLR